MNICFQTGDFPESGGCGGIGAYVKSIARPLREAGHKIYALVPGAGGVESSREEDGIMVYRVRLPRWHRWVQAIPILGAWFAGAIRELEWSWAYHRGLCRMLKVHRLDVLESSEEANFFHVLCKKIPLVIRLHGEDYTFKKFSGLPLDAGVRLTRTLQRIAIRRADMLTCPSAYHGKEIQTECGVAESIEVYPNPVASFWSPLEEEGSDAKEQPSILYSGRLEYRKGPQILLRAIPMVRAAVPHARVWFAGAEHPSISRDMWEETIRQEGVAGAIQRMGSLSQEALLKLYRRCTVFVFPSHYETFGMVVVEAMACGKAVIAANTSAFPEIITNGVNGLLVASGDAEKLAKAIVRLLQDRPLRERLGQAARASVLDRYCPDRVAARMAELYSRFRRPA